MRVVIDSNVWISALVFGGNPRQIFDKAVRDGWTIVVSEEIFTEVRRTLAKKFTAYVSELDNLRLILGARIFTASLGSIHVRVSRDEDDNRVIETAVIGGASCIISGDKDLLILENYRGIEILSPGAFLEQVV